MQAISKGLEKVVQELTASENDGPVSETFCKVTYINYFMHTYPLEFANWIALGCNKIQRELRRKMCSKQSFQCKKKNQNETG